MRPLYEIGLDLSALAEMLLNLDGEFTDDETGQALEAYFDHLTDERDEKIRRICCLIASLQASAEACKLEAARINRLRVANENLADRLKGRLKQFFEDHQITKIDLGAFKPRI